MNRSALASVVVAVPPSISSAVRGTVPPDNPAPEPDIGPTNDVAVSAPDDELNVRLLPVFGS